MNAMLLENSVVLQAVGSAFGEAHIGPVADLAQQISDLAEDHTRQQAFWRESEKALMRVDIFYGTGLVRDDEWGDIHGAMSEEFHACAGDAVHLTTLIALMMTHLRGPRLGSMFAWLCGLRDPEILAKAQEMYKDLASQVEWDCDAEASLEGVNLVIAALREAHDGKEVGV